MITRLLLLLCLFVARASATLWYVDNAAAGTNAGTSWTNAWNAFSSVVWGGAGVVAGDTLYISGGTTSKTYTTRLTVGASGTAGNVITISTGQDASHNGVVIIDGANTIAGSQRGIDASSRSYLRVTGNVGGARNLKVQNFVCSASDRDTTGGVGVWLGANSIFEYIEIDHAMNGFYWSQSSGTVCGIELRYCYTHDIQGDYGVRITGYTGSDFNNALVHDNTIYTNGSLSGTEGGPDGVQCLNGITMYNNIMRSVQGATVPGTGAGNQHPDGIQAMGSYHKIYNNYFANYGNSCAKLGPISGTVTWQAEYVWNNIFCIDTTINTSNLMRGLEPTPDGATCATVQDIYIVNNTFVDLNFLAINGDVDVPATTVTNVVIENNIFYNCGAQGGGTLAVWLNQTNGTTGVTINYNTTNAGSEGVTPFNFPSTSPYTPANPLTTAPTFVTYSTRSQLNNYNLSVADTGARDRGVDVSAYLAAFATDKNGVLRSGSWDNGAYEYTQATNTPAASPPFLRRGVGVGF
jgi:hypothetical protein